MLNYLTDMSQALYRKWRPARFDEVVGQEHVTRTLQNAVAANRIGHAYLFSGPRGTGKTTIARLVAKAANCLDDDLAPNTGVDDIRSLREKINFAPSEGRYKVYIIDEVHMLSTAAFNALLKTLEEPPAHAIFVLATTEEHKVPLTIKSRCQPFSFRLFTTEEITGRLTWMAKQEQLVIEPQAIEMIAKHAAGSLRDAESLLDQLVAAPGDTITLARTRMVLGTANDVALRQLTNAWLHGDGRQGLTVIHEALGAGADPRQFARQMVAYLRQVLLLKTGGRELVVEGAADRRDGMVHQAQEADRQALIEALKRFNEAASAPAVSWQPQLPLELAFIELLPPGNDASLLDTSPVATESEEEQTAEVQTADESGVKTSSPPPKQPAQTSESSPPAEAVPAITINSVAQSWPRLREMVGKRDKSLPGLLASAKPLAMEGNTLILGFEFPILKDRFDGQKGAKATVASALSQLLKNECQVQTVVAGQYQPEPADRQIDDDDFAALADELGGIVQPLD